MKMNPFLWGAEAIAAVLEVVLETRRSLQRVRAAEMTTQTVHLLFIEHLEHFVEKTKQDMRDEADPEFKKMLKLQVTKLEIFQHLFKHADAIEKHFWLWSQFKLGWRGCQRLQLASAEDVFFEVQAEMLEKELQECLQKGGGGAVPGVPAAAGGAVPAVPGVPAGHGGEVLAGDGVAVPSADASA